MKRSMLLLLLLAFAGALHAAAATDGARRTLACPIPTAGFAHDPADHEPADAARLDAASRGRIVAAALDSTPPDTKAIGAFGAASPALVRIARAAPRRPWLGLGSAQSTYLLTRRLRI